MFGYDIEYKKMCRIFGTGLMITIYKDRSYQMNMIKINRKAVHWH